MKLSRRDLYTLAGLGLIVGAFFQAANAIGGLMALVYFLASTDFGDAYPSISENIVNSLKASQTTGMVHNVASFLILFFGGRWMLRGPKFLDRWIDGDGGTHEEDAAHTVNSSSAQTGTEHSATHSESKSYGGDKPQPESEERSR
jgi:hypothetical protein